MAENLLKVTEVEFSDHYETTVDTFHNASFAAVQPKEHGHRSGLDALLLAAAVPWNAHGVLVDLGAGSGVAGLAALNLNNKLELVSVEADPFMCQLAQHTLDLPGNAALRDRARVLQTDVTASARHREEAGLVPGVASHVIMNPPYNPITMRTSPDPLKAAAHMMGEGGLDAWFRTASAIVKPGGTLSIIYRTEQLGDLLACSQGRFGGLEIMPIHSRSEEPAKRLLARGTRGSRAPLSIVPGLVIHNADGSFTGRANAIFAGEGHLQFTA